MRLYYMESTPCRQQARRVKEAVIANPAAAG